MLVIADRIRCLTKREAYTSAGFVAGLLMAQSGHSSVAARCPLLGVKRTLTNRCSAISIYEYTP
jgi:hypothetical protein